MNYLNINITRFIVFLVWSGIFALPLTSTTSDASAEDKNWGDKQTRDRKSTGSPAPTASPVKSDAPNLKNKSDTKYAAPQRLRTDNIDFEVARVKEQIRQIQQSSIPHDSKIARERAVLDTEITRAKTQMREIQSSSPKDVYSPRDRRKAGLDSLQKFLDIVRSMNPTI